MKRPIILAIMDGYGISEKIEGNAIKAAYKPNLDFLINNCPNIKLKAHGDAVGMPTDDDMGNSEVGHNALGSGQIYAQGAKLVNQSINNKELFKSNTWKNLIQNVLKNNSTLHFIGLLSDGNVHSNIEHLFAMVKQSKIEGIRRLRAHILLDGRDVFAQSAIEYIEKLESLFEFLNDENFDAKIASGGGRQKITMDRYGANWPMVEEGWNCHVHAIGEQFESAKKAVLAAREENPDIIDQDLPAFVISENGNPVGKIKDNDSVILSNFRGDRAQELSLAFDKHDFTMFDRGDFPKVMFAGMLQYDGDAQIPKNYLVSPPSIKNTLTEELIKNNIKSFAVSETQKYGHVTYFWNGNKLEKFSEQLEFWQEIPSDLVSFDERPWMKGAEITDSVINALKSCEYSFIRANYPNGDMVGHTGNFQATKISIESVDLCIGRLIKAAKEYNAILIVLADHGNADEMLEKDNKSPKTAHTLNPVPFIIFDPKENYYKFKNGNFGIANVAATIADIFGITPNKNWEESVLDKL